MRLKYSFWSIHSLYHGNFHLKNLFNILLLMPSFFIIDSEDGFKITFFFCFHNTQTSLSKSHWMVCCKRF